MSKTILNVPKTEKEEEIIRLRSGLEEERSRKPRKIKEWHGVTYNKEAMKFCIYQTHRALKNCRLSVLKD